MQLVVNQPEKITRKVKTELKDRGIKQKDLAEYMGLSESALARLLSGESLKQHHMAKITSFLGVDLNFFNFNSNLKAVADQENRKENVKSANAEIEYLKEVIRTKDEVIKSKDESIKAKDDLIATLREKLTK